MKQVSVSGVITNSSTEVFTIYNDPDGIEKVKELVTSILQVTSEYTFDDLFTIELGYDSGEALDRVVAELYDAHSGETGYDPEKDLVYQKYLDSEEELDKWVKDYVENKEESDDTPLYSCLKVTPKDGLDCYKTQEVARNLENIANLFESRSIYC